MRKSFHSWCLVKIAWSLKLVKIAAFKGEKAVKVKVATRWLHFKVLLLVDAQQFFHSILQHQASFIFNWKFESKSWKLVINIINWLSWLRKSILSQIVGKPDKQMKKSNHNKFNNLRDKSNLISNSEVPGEKFAASSTQELRTSNCIS